jgi:acyl-CoA thioester hydrolase
MLPSYEQVLELEELLSGNVSPDFIDANGHMNIRHYLDYGATSADVMIRRMGIDDGYRAQRRLGVFTAEHHIRYFSEMHEGGSFSVHSLFLGRSAKAGHILAFILDRDRGLLACTVEIVLVHVGMDTRRPVDFPKDVVIAIDEWVAEADKVTWPIPLSGAMGLRS